MIQKLTLALLIALPLAAFAKSQGDQSEAAPGVQWTHTGNYIYRKQALRVTLDPEQRAAMKKSADFISNQLSSLAKNNVVDTDGDLQAINSSLVAMNSKVESLVQAAEKLYGNAAPYGIRLYDGLPTGVILFGGVEYDKNLIKFVTGGGSVMLGAVLVPMSVERTDIYTREVVHYIEWSSSLILIPVANAGAGVVAEAAPSVSNKRFGAGLVWGNLNSPSELTGATYGPSTTLAIGEGLNVKVLGLKNFSKEGAVNNVILLAGVEQGTLAAETHLNIGAIVDATAFLKGISNTGAGVVQWIQGAPKGKDSAQ